MGNKGYNLRLMMRCFKRLIDKVCFRLASKMQTNQVFVSLLKLLLLLDDLTKDWYLEYVKEC